MGFGSAATAKRRQAVLQGMGDFMPTFYKIDKAHRIVMSTASGIFDLAAALAHQEKLTQDADFDPGYSQLFDFRQVSKVALGPEDVRKIAERSVFWPCSRRAILVNNDLEFGFARIFEMLRDNAGEKGIKVFRNIDEALEWILPDQSKFRNPMGDES
jgi:hypothetical protein